MRRCSCGQQLDTYGELTAHLADCPVEADALPISEATAAWAADTYDDTTLTLDQWREKYA